MRFFVRVRRTISVGYLHRVTFTSRAERLDRTKTRQPTAKIETCDYVFCIAVIIHPYTAIYHLARQVNRVLGMTDDPGGSFS